MNELQTMWSISRRKSLINCPREYVLKYSNNPEYCKKCSFKNSCPAKKGLVKAKIEQVLSEYNFAKEKFDSN